VVAERRLARTAQPGASPAEPLRGGGAHGHRGRRGGVRGLCGPDAGAHLEAIGEFADAGFDHVYVHQVGPDQEGFIAFYEREVLPEARELVPRMLESVTARAL
jgi:hypothetical protein